MATMTAEAANDLYWSVLAQPELRAARREIQTAYNAACIASRSANAYARSGNERANSLSGPTARDERATAEYQRLFDAYHHGSRIAALAAVGLDSRGRPLA